MDPTPGMSVNWLAAIIAWEWIQFPTALSWTVYRQLVRLLAEQQRIDICSRLIRGWAMSWQECSRKNSQVQQTPDSENLILVYDR